MLKKSLRILTTMCLVTKKVKRKPQVHSSSLKTPVNICKIVKHQSSLLLQSQLMSKLSLKPSLQIYRWVLGIQGVINHRGRYFLPQYVRQFSQKLILKFFWKNKDNTTLKKTEEQRAPLSDTEIIIRVALTCEQINLSEQIRKHRN